jgi:long-chain acyl-CoA synthetase
MDPQRPWLAHYEPGIPALLPPVDEPFHAALESAAATSPGYPAIKFFGSSMSYAELDALSDRVAAALERDGLKPGESVVTALPHCPYLAAGCLGVLKAGGVAAPVAPDLSRDELVAIAEAVQPRFALASPSSARALLGALPFGDSTVVVASAARSLPSLVRLIARVSRSSVETNGRELDGTVEWDSWLKGAGTTAGAQIDPSAPALLLAPTSDLAPRLYSHMNLVAGAAQLRAWLTDAMPGEDTWLQLAPLWSGLGFVSGLGTAMVTRSQVALVPSWKPQDALDALRYLRPTYIVAGKDAAEIMAGDTRLAKVDLRSVRAWLTDQPLSTEVSRAFEELAGFSLCQGYGPVGVAGLALCNPVNGRRVAGSLGVPLPGIDAQVIGPTAKPLPSGQVGDLALTGPNVVGEGWLTTGLQARIDDAGFVYAVA